MGTEGDLPSGGWGFIVLTLLANVPMYTLTPRFILSMRELYACDVQNGLVGGIDSKFGLSTMSAGGTMVFAHRENWNEDAEDGEAIPMEVGTAR